VSARTRVLGIAAAVLVALLLAACSGTGRPGGTAGISGLGGGNSALTH